MKTLIEFFDLSDLTGKEIKEGVALGAMFLVWVIGLFIIFS